MNFLTLFAILIIVHSIYNLVNYLRFPYIEKLLFGNYTTDANLSMKAKMHKNTILNYIKYAGVKDEFMPVSQALGYGQISNANISVFSNILNPRQDIASVVFELLLEAKGNYLSKFVNSFNPFYWLRIFLYIPKYLLSYFGVKPDSFIIKICQSIYWILGIIFTFSIAIFPNEIKSFIFSLLHIS